MTAEVELYQSNLPALPARVGVPGTQDFDSWIAVADKTIKLANHICDTPFVPDGMRGSAPAVAAAMLAGREMGLGPMTSLANLDVIKGKPSMKPVLMRALVQSKGHKWVDVEVSDVRVIIRGCRKGESEWTEVTFTQAHARLAGINLGGYPADKLYARASSRLARRKFADVIMGMAYSEDELEDGITEAGEVLAVTAPPAAAAIEAPKPRTAQRKTRQAAPAAEPADRPTGAASATGSAAATQDRRAPAPATTAPSADAIPFPEDEQPDPTSAATAATSDATTARHGTGDDKHRKLVGIVQAHFKRLGFADGDRADRLKVCGQIVNTAPPASSSDLTAEQLSVIADTMSRCRDWDALSLLLTAGDKPDGGDSDG